MATVMPDLWLPSQAQLYCWMIETWGCEQLARNLLITSLNAQPIAPLHHLQPYLVYNLVGIYVLPEDLYWNIWLSTIMFCVVCSTAKLCSAVGCIFRKKKRNLECGTSTRCVRTNRLTILTVLSTQRQSHLLEVADRHRNHGIFDRFKCPILTML